jgi:hypothetical protein
MRKLMVVCAVCAVMAVLASVAMADNGIPSAAKMQQMGLSSATVVSDSVAMNVRGLGYSGKSKSSVVAWGSSKVQVVTIGCGTVTCSESEHGYVAEGSTIAAGADISFVGNVSGEAGSGWFGTTNWSVGGSVLFAGGGSVAVAH